MSQDQAELIENIKDVLEVGIVSDLFKAQRSYYVHRMIGKHAKEINKAKRHQREVFVLLQNLMFSDMTLALTKLFDTPKKYPTRCILTLIDQLKELSINAPAIIETIQLIDQVRVHEFPDILIQDVNEKNFTGFTQHFAWHIESMYYYPGFQKKIEELKTVRDKHIAHNEATEIQHKARYKTFEDLIYYCQSVVSIVGMAYFSTIYSLNEKYLLQDDAKRISYQLEHLMKDLGIIDK
jgi:hypothetical protein